MDSIELDVSVPQYSVPESMLFAHRTRLADSWFPAPEAIVQPALEIGPGSIVIRVSDGTTCEYQTRHPLKYLRRLRTERIEGKYLFDLRHTDLNMAHLLDHASYVLLAKKHLAAAVGRPIEIYVLVRSVASRMAKECYRLLGIPIIATDARVEGTIVQVSDQQTEVRAVGGTLCKKAPAVVGLLPEIFDGLPKEEAPAETPEKVYIARKTSRSILNASEITNVLEREGFKTYFFEDIPVREQWRIVRNAREVVAIHGAALGALVFNRNGLKRSGNQPGFSLIELYGAGYLVDSYRRYTAALKGRWCGVRGQITPDIVCDLDVKGNARAHQASPFRVDPETLKMALDYCK
jgi:hypothetical protein